MVRRSFWNYLKNRPMKFTGEWVFAGGKYDHESDNGSPLFQTGEREFREELDYKGEITLIGPLLTGNFNGNGHPGDKTPHRLGFYAVKIEDDPLFNILDKGEVMQAYWFYPIQAWNYLKSDSFDREQGILLNLLQEQHPGHEIHELQVPYATIRTLEILAENESLLLSTCLNQPASQPHASLR